MTIEEYRDRTKKQKYTLDGSPIFTTDEDMKNEQVAANICAKVWDCELHHLGIYSPIDYWACRHGQPVGWVEVKHREFAGHESYDTCLLNVRKWITLNVAAVTSPVPSIFVYSSHFKDTDRLIVRWILVSEIDGRGADWQVIYPRGGVVKSRNDIEPCILIKHDDMKVIYDSTYPGL